MVFTYIQMTAHRYHINCNKQHSVHYVEQTCCMGASISNCLIKFLLLHPPPQNDVTLRGQSTANHSQRLFWGVEGYMNYLLQTGNYIPRCTTTGSYRQKIKGWSVVIMTSKNVLTKCSLCIMFPLFGSIFGHKKMEALWLAYYCISLNKHLYVATVRYLLCHGNK